MAITILKEIAEALSTMPTLRTCAKKNFITSYKGIPWKPGGCIFLLQPTINVTGGEETKRFFVALTTFIIVYPASLYRLNPAYSMTAGILSHISYDRQSWW